MGGSTWALDDISVFPLTAPQDNDCPGGYCYADSIMFTCTVSCIYTWYKLLKKFINKILFADYDCFYGNNSLYVSRNVLQTQ